MFVQCLNCDNEDIIEFTCSTCKDFVKFKTDDGSWYECHNEIASKYLNAKALNKNFGCKFYQAENDKPFLI